MIQVELGSLIKYYKCDAAQRRRLAFLSISKTRSKAEKPQNPLKTLKPKLGEMAMVLGALRRSASRLVIAESLLALLLV